MTVKIELGFTADGQGAPFFTLDDPTLGVLDSDAGVLGGGEIFVDISSYFITYNTTRGKSRELDRYQAGQASVTFQNNQRVFDPTYATSPFFGQIVPKRQLRISNDDVVQFQGVVEDWNISYEPGGQSIATCQAFDNFSYLSGLTFGSEVYAEESAGTRLNNVLDSINWSATAREIGDTSSTLAAGTVAADTQVLEYLDRIARSEPGDLFVAKDSKIKFVGRNQAFVSGDVVFSDDGANIPYKTIGAIYGSELLYNKVTTTSAAGTATAEDSTSVQIYGERDLEVSTFLSSTEQLQQLSSYLTSRYSEPEFRFENLTLDLQEIGASNRAEVLDLELGDIVKIEFTPNGIAPAIERFGKIIGISQAISPGSEEVNINLQSTAGAVFVLDDALFGKLDNDNGLGW